MLSEEEKIIRNRWRKKRDSVKNLQSNISRLNRYVSKLISSNNEKDQLTGVVLRIMMKTHERVGNYESAKNGRFGVTQFRKKHVHVSGNKITFDYVGKSKMKQSKSFSDARVASILRKYLKKDNVYVFTTSDGFRIKPDRINRVLSKFNISSKDIRGYNSNKLMQQRLKNIRGKVEKKQRPKVFNENLRKVAEIVGHTPATLRKHYLLPEIERKFYQSGKI